MNLQNLVDLGQWQGIDIFSGVTVPAPLNADTVKSAIMVRSGLMTPLYLEPAVFQSCVTQWFIRKQWTIEHLIKIIQADYSPIENYDRTEDSNIIDGSKDTIKKTGGYTDKLSGSDSLEYIGSKTNALTGTDTEAHSGTDTTTNEVSAYNSATYSADNKSSLLHGESIGTTYGKSETESFTNRNDKTTYGKQLQRTDNGTETKQTDGSRTTSSHVHGNIGVTTTQQMIEQELELLRHFDIYGWIAENFEDENMLLIY